MNNILVPIDFSSTSGNALRYACNVAKKFSSRIEVVHVYRENLEEEMSKSQVLHVNTAELSKIQIEKVQKYVEEFQVEFPMDASGLQINFQALLGSNTGDELLSYCDANPIRLIIMGTKGESPGADKMMGSVTSEVIKKVSTPLLAIPEAAIYKEIKRIVYCIDYEGYDRFTINSLAAFAGMYDAEIIVLHINTEPQYFDSARWANFQRMVNDAYDYENMRFEFLNHENIIEGIEGYLADKDIDIISLLTRNHHLIDKVFPKSITRKMVLHTTLPLLAFHE